MTSNAKLTHLTPTRLSLWLLRIAAKLMGGTVRVYKVRERKEKDTP